MKQYFKCNYPHYRSFEINHVYEGDKKDMMTNTTVQEWAESNPDHWEQIKTNNYERETQKIN